ncbi:MAG: copper-binding protein [Gallionella sp.]|nr:copper-binding protein [Gallionella sp.]
MLHIITSSLFLVLLASTNVGAADHQHMSHDVVQTADVAKTMQWTNGEVKRVDHKKGKVTLHHAEIVNVMPAMTMAYRLKDTAMLKSLHAGDKVSFVLEKQGDAYLVTHIRRVK